MRKIQGMSSVPLRQRLAVIARAAAAKANRYRVSVTGLNALQLHQSVPGSFVFGKVFQ